MFRTERMCIMPRRGLQVGENNIASSTAKDHGKTPGKRGHTWSLQWFANTGDGSKRHFTKVTNATKADCYAAANRRFRDLMEQAHLPGDGTWTQRKRMRDFVEQVCIPEIEANEYAKALRPNTIARYKCCLKHYAKQVKRMDIADAIIPDNLQKCFKAIAMSSGNPTAEQTAKVASKYVMDVLVRKRVIEHNPLRPRTIEVTVREKSEKPAVDGNKALLPEQRRRVVEYLLELDPAQPHRKRWSSDVMTAKRSCLIDWTLLQATTGLRIAEARQLTANDVTDTGNRLTVTVTEDVSKTHRGRTVPVMDERVADRMRDRLRAAESRKSGLLFPRPSTDTAWDSKGAQNACRSFYSELADALDIPMLKEPGVLTHVWRATLNSEWADLGVSVERRSAYFGQSSEVNRAYYTDLVDLSVLEEQVKGHM